MTTKKKMIAARAYQNSHDETLTLLDVAKSLVAKHSALQADDYTNWQFVGDMGRLRSSLFEAVAAIGSAIDIKGPAAFTPKVHPALGCPTCGECHADLLVHEDDAGAIHCETCSTRYNAATGTELGRY